MMKLLEKFYPDERRNSVYEIDFDSLYRKGIRGLIFDTILLFLMAPLQRRV